MIVLEFPKLLFPFNRDSENISTCSVLSNWMRKSLGNGKNNAKLKMVQPKFSPSLGEIDGKFYSTWDLGKYRDSQIYLPADADVSRGDASQRSARLVIAGLTWVGGGMVLRGWLSGCGRRENTGRGEPSRA